MRILFSFIFIIIYYFFNQSLRKALTQYTQIYQADNNYNNVKLRCNTYLLNKKKKLFILTPAVLNIKPRSWGKTKAPKKMVIENLESVDPRRRMMKFPDNYDAYKF